MPEQQMEFTENQIRRSNPRQVAKFLDSGKSVDQGHLRAALSLALKEIAELRDQLTELTRTPPISAQARVHRS